MWSLFCSSRSKFLIFTDIVTSHILCALCLLLTWLWSLPDLSLLIAPLLPSSFLFFSFRLLWAVFEPYSGAPARDAESEIQHDRPRNPVCESVETNHSAHFCPHCCCCCGCCREKVSRDRCYSTPHFSDVTWPLLLTTLCFFLCSSFSLLLFSFRHLYTTSINFILFPSSYRAQKQLFEESAKLAQKQSKKCDDSIAEIQKEIMKNSKALSEMITREKEREKEKEKMVLKK